jgi:hypothetical protein
MPLKLIKIFVGSASMILILTSIAKFISGFGTAPLLDEQDPIFGTSFRIAYLVVGTIELTVGIFCFVGEGFNLKLYLLSWLSTVFVIYRFGLIFLNYHKSCSCLGNVTQSLHIAPATADSIMKAVVCYLTLGSYGSLLFVWSEKRRPTVVGVLLSETPQSVP